MDASEDDKIQAMMSQSTHEYDPSRYMKIRGANQVGPVPISYRCHKCHGAGHWIKHCPLNAAQPLVVNAGKVGTQTKPGEIRKSTGIPRSFMVFVDGPQVPGALMTQTGQFAVPVIDHEAYKEQKRERPPFQPESAVPEEKPSIPEELLCNICKDLLTDAVLIHCCGNSYCDECIRSALLESEDHQCPDCREKDVSPDTLIPNRFLRRAVSNFRNETGYSKVKRSAQKSKERPAVEIIDEEPVTVVEEQSQPEVVEEISEPAPVSTIPTVLDRPPPISQPPPALMDVSVSKPSEIEDVQPVKSLVADKPIPERPFEPAAELPPVSAELPVCTEPPVSAAQPAFSEPDRARRQKHFPVSSNLRPETPTIDEQTAELPDTSVPPPSMRGPLKHDVQQIQIIPSLRKTHSHGGPPGTHSVHRPPMDLGHHRDQQGYGGGSRLPGRPQQFDRPPPNFPQTDRLPNSGHHSRGPPLRAPGRGQRGRGPGYRTSPGSHQPPPPGLGRGSLHNGNPQATIDDPLEAFERMLREKDERDKKLRRTRRSHSRSRSFSRSPSRSRSRSRPLFSRSRSRSRSRNNIRSRTKSRTRSRSRSRSITLSRSRSPFSRSPTPRPLAPREFSPRTVRYRTHSRSPPPQRYPQHQAPRPFRDARTDYQGAPGTGAFYGTEYQQHSQQGSGGRSGYRGGRGRGGHFNQRKDYNKGGYSSDTTRVVGYQDQRYGGRETSGRDTRTEGAPIPVTASRFDGNYSQYEGYETQQQQQRRQYGDYDTRYDQRAYEKNDYRRTEFDQGTREYYEYSQYNKESRDYEAPETRKKHSSSPPRTSNRSHHQSTEPRKTSEKDDSKKKHRKKVEKETRKGETEAEKHEKVAVSRDAQEKKDHHHADDGKDKKLKGERKKRKKEKRKNSAEDTEKSEVGESESEKLKKKKKKEKIVTKKVAPAPPQPAATSAPKEMINQGKVNRVEPVTGVPRRHFHNKGDINLHVLKVVPISSSPQPYNNNVEVAGLYNDIEGAQVDSKVLETYNQNVTKEKAEAEPVKEDVTEEKIPPILTEIKVAVSETEEAKPNTIPEVKPSAETEVKQSTVTEVKQSTVAEELPKPENAPPPSKWEYPEPSKWEREEDGLLEEGRSDDRNGSESRDKVVTSDILKRAENAIFQKAINAIRPADSGKKVERKVHLAEKEEKKRIEIFDRKEIEIRQKSLEREKKATPTTIQITIPAGGREEPRSVEIHDPVKAKPRLDRTRFNPVLQPPPVAAQEMSPKQRRPVRERLGAKVESSSRHEHRTSSKHRDASKSQERPSHMVAKHPHRVIKSAVEKTAVLQHSPTLQVSYKHGIRSPTKEKKKTHGRHKASKEHAKERHAKSKVDKKKVKEEKKKSRKKRTSRSESAQEVSHKESKKRKKEKKHKKDKAKEHKHKKEHGAKQRTKSVDGNKQESVTEQMQAIVPAADKQVGHAMKAEKGGGDDAKKEQNKQRKNPRLASDRRKSTLDESHFEPDYDATSGDSEESEGELDEGEIVDNEMEPGEVESTGSPSLKRAANTVVAAEPKKKHKVETKTVTKRSKKKRVQSSSSSSSSSEETSSDSSSSESESSGESESSSSSSSSSSEYDSSSESEVEKKRSKKHRRRDSKAKKKRSKKRR